MYVFTYLFVLAFLIYASQTKENLLASYQAPWNSP